MKRRDFISKTAAWVLAGGIYVPRIVRAQPARALLGVQPPFRAPSGAAAASYVANAVSFVGGGVSWLEMDTDWAGNADSKLLTVSFFYRPDTLTGNQIIFHDFSGTTVPTGDKCEVQKMITTDAIRVRCRNASNTTIAQLDQNTASFPALTVGNWYHIYASFDLANVANRFLYINGTSCLTATTYTNDTMEFTSDDHAIGAAVGGGLDLIGCLSEAVYAPGLYTGNSWTSFNSASAGSTPVPVNIGSDGSVPFGGTAPKVYMKNPAASYTTNSGSGGNYVKKGGTPFSDCSNHP